MSAPRPVVTLMRGADLVASPWKNGGGVTREIAAFPAGSGIDAFTWRVSLADVAQPGPFSRFAGIDRVLVLLSGAGMLLDEAGGVTHALHRPLDSARFAGETAIDARLADGPTRDFNLMMRRGVASGEVDVWRGAGSHTLHADVVLLFCASGNVTVTIDAHAPGVALTADDTLQIDSDAAHALQCTIEGSGALLAVSIQVD